MSDIAMTLAFLRDINAPLITERPVTLLMQGDAMAQTIRVILMDDGKRVELDAYTATGYLIRADGVKIPCESSIGDSVIDITLNAHCYAVPGPFAMNVRVSGADGMKRTIAPPDRCSCF